MNPTNMQLVAALLFGLALIHTFSTKVFERLADAHPAHAGLWHLLGEIEVVFGFWALVLIQRPRVEPAPQQHRQCRGPFARIPPSGLRRANGDALRTPESARRSALVYCRAEAHAARTCPACH